MQVQWMDIERLVPYERNAKEHPVEQIDKIAASIDHLGWDQPLVVDERMEIIKGHGRYFAVERLGRRQAPVVVREDLTEEQKRAARLADNRTAESDWDWNLVKVELEELQGLDFDIDVVGFDDEELSILHDDSGESSSVNEQREKVELVQDGGIDQLVPSEEELEHLRRRKVLISFSGGVDLSLAAYWARYFLPENEIELCFADLGADYPTLPPFLENFATLLDVNLKVVRSKENIIHMMLRKGAWPHFRHSYCHDLLHKALDTHLLAHNPNEVVMMRGGRASEKAARSKESESRFMQIQRIADYTIFQPMYFASKSFGADVLHSAGLPTWDGYEWGLHRTACRVCPGQKPRAYAAIRTNFPDVWQELKDLEAVLGRGFWHDPTDGDLTLEELADRGQPLFEEDGYPRRCAKQG